MDTHLLKLVKTKQPLSCGIVEHARECAFNALISGSEVFDGKQTHSFDDAIEFLWSDESFSSRVLSEFQSIAANNTSPVLHAVLTDAVEAYVETFVYQLAEKNLSDSVQSHIESLTDENQAFRGVL